MDIQLGFLPQTFFLVLARFGGVIATVPFFGGARTSAPIRAALAFILALLITPLAPDEWVAAAGAMQNLAAVTLGVLGEVILGAAIGFIAAMFNAIFTIAGDIIAHGAGLMMAREIDPTTEVSNTMFANLLQMTFVLLVVLSNGHLVLIRLVAGSFYQAPPQLAWVTKDLIQGMILLGSSMFEYALRLAGPVIAMGMILNTGFALIARVAPDVNILFLSMPIRLIGTLAILGMMIHLSSYFFDNLIEAMLRAFAEILL